MCSISVIIPIYNTSKYLHHCINGILAQTFTDFELILVDDGSLDDCGDICDEYAQNDERLIVVHKPNGGQATARNVALDISQGDYIGFVDSDDYLDSTMYYRLHAEIEMNKNTISMCGRKTINEDGTNPQECFCYLSSQVWVSQEAIKRFLLWDGIDGSSCDKLMPRSLIGDKRYPTGYICEDIPFVFSVIEKCDKIIHIGKPLYFYRQIENSTSHNQCVSKNTEGLVKYNKEIYEYIKRNKPELINEARYFYLHMALYYHNLLIHNHECGENYQKNRAEIIKVGRTISSQSVYFEQYEIHEIKRISCWYYPIYKKIKSFSHWWVNHKKFDDFLPHNKIEGWKDNDI